MMCIATNHAPCDLHVLNTPPAFVLSQNQTLRKYICIRKIPLKERLSRKSGYPVQSLLLPEALVPDLFLRVSRLLPPSSQGWGWADRAAHNSIFFFLPDGLLHATLVSPGSQSRVVHGVKLRLRESGWINRPGHTVKEPHRESTRNPIGWFVTPTDLLSLGRPSSWRPAKLHRQPPLRQHLLPFFFHFFRPLAQVPHFQGFMRWIFANSGGFPRPRASGFRGRGGKNGEFGGQIGRNGTAWGSLLRDLGGFGCNQARAGRGTGPAPGNWVGARGVGGPGLGAEVSVGDAGQGQRR